MNIFLQKKNYLIFQVLNSQLSQLRRLVSSTCVNGNQIQPYARPTSVIVSVVKRLEACLFKIFKDIFSFFIIDFVQRQIQFLLFFVVFVVENLWISVNQGKKYYY
jgi:hypothetical protein